MGILFIILSKQDLLSDTSMANTGASKLDWRSKLSHRMESRSQLSHQYKSLNW